VLLSVQRSLQLLIEQFREPNDRMERRAQFVAHARQELTVSGDAFDQNLSNNTASVSVGVP
jgi:hypothetical protein